MHEEQYLKVTHPATLADVKAALATLREPDEAWAEVMEPLRSDYSATVVAYGRDAVDYAKVVQHHLSEALAPARVLTESQVAAERNARDGGR